MFHFGFDRFSAQVFIADSTFSIEQISGWKRSHAPFFHTALEAVIEDVVPVHSVLVALRDEAIGVGISVDAQDCELVVVKTLNQRFFVRDFSLARASPKSPEHEVGDFALVVGQRDGFSADVFAFKLWS